MNRLANILDQKERERKYARERARAKREDPEYRALELERNRQWRERNPEKLRQIRSASHRKWYTENREKKLEQNRQWKRDNPEKVREYQRRRVGLSSVLRQAGPESKEYARILRLDPCSYCGEFEGTIDHIEPVDQGGVNHWTNFTAACGSCNSRKGTTPLLEFLCRA
jgi:5-methylcytosine-specific restriction endonuclease McrA